MFEENLIYPPPNTISTYDMAQQFHVDESFIIQLCRGDFLDATYQNDEWFIKRSSKLPCVKEFIVVADYVTDENFKMLNRDYELIRFTGYECWDISLRVSTDFIDFKELWVGKALYKDNEGRTYQKWTIEIYNYVMVASLDQPLQTILQAIKTAKTSCAEEGDEVVGVFDSEAEAYIYARKFYPEICLEDKIKLKLFNKHFNEIMSP